MKYKSFDDPNWNVWSQYISSLTDPDTDCSLCSLQWKWGCIKDRMLNQNQIKIHQKNQSFTKQYVKQLSAHDGSEYSF